MLNILDGLFNGMNLVSVITVAIKRGDEFLIVSKQSGSDDDVVWGFPFEEFKENVIGNLRDTITRVLESIAGNLKNASGVEYLGSYLRELEENIHVGYDFLVENFEGDVSAESFRWVKLTEIRDTVIDQNTKIFLELNDDLL